MVNPASKHGKTWFLDFKPCYYNGARELARPLLILPSPLQSRALLASDPPTSGRSRLFSAQLE